MLKAQLLLVSDAYASAVGLSRSRISTIVLNRGSTLDSMAAGKADVTTGTFEKAMAWFSSNWPAGTEWPADIDRPSHPTDAGSPSGVVADSAASQAGIGQSFTDLPPMTGAAE